MSLVTPLTIELVPSTCWYSNVRSNVTKSQWNKIKKVVAEKAGHRCEICNGVGPRWPVECHEIWMYNQDPKIQVLTRLIALCPACHEVKHYGLATIRGTEKRAFKQLMFVNKWTANQTHEHIKQQMELWEQRSQFHWELDLSYLCKVFNICI